MRYSSYTTGILELDIQHANIDFILSELVQEGLRKEASGKSYETLRKAIALHFDFEDEWAQTNNKNFDVAHQKAHTELLEKLNEFGNHYTNNKLNMYEISLTLKIELLKHVQDHDIKLGAKA